MYARYDAHLSLMLTCFHENGSGLELTARQKPSVLDWTWRCLGNLYGVGRPFCILCSPKR